jgi:hypothetical protein
MGGRIGVPVDIKPRIVSTNVTWDDGTGAIYPA